MIFPTFAAEQPVSAVVSALQLSYFKLLCLHAARSRPRYFCTFVYVCPRLYLQRTQVLPCNIRFFLFFVGRCRSDHWARLASG